jgi:hypothetical protein
MVEEGNNITFTITAYSGYMIDYVLVNSENKGAIASYTFENVMEDGTIEVVFKEQVGIVETQCLASLRVYPNPTTGELRMENGEWRIENVEFFDISGKQIVIPNAARNLEGYETQPQADGVVLNISHFPTGIYFLRIQTEQGVVVKKVIKQ